MAERRRYGRRTKSEAVGLSVVSSTSEAARKMNIPRKTIAYWREQPEFAELRQQKSEDVAADVWATFQDGVRRVKELIPQTDDLTKVATATGILYDKFALMSGHATQRTETADVTAKLSDHETAALEDALENLLESAK